MQEYLVRIKEKASTFLQEASPNQKLMLAGVALMVVIGIAGCGIIGFYDGFFGPGAGSLLMLWMIRFYGYDFLNAAGSARLINTFTNGASILWFGFHGTVGWPVGLAMAAFNIMGAQLGTRLAFLGGVKFIRVAFLIIVSSLIIKTAWQSLQVYGWRSEEHTSELQSH